MYSENGIQLHFDFLSRKALLRCAGREYVLPDVYPNREGAEAAAHRFVRETLRPEIDLESERKIEDQPIYST